MAGLDKKVEDEFKKFKDVHSGMDKAEEHADHLDHIVSEYYHTFVSKKKLHEKKFEFDDKTKEEFVKGFINSLKGHLVYSKKIKGLDSMDDPAWENILEVYFGTSTESLTRKLKNKKVLGPEFIRRAINSPTKEHYTDMRKKDSLKYLKEEDLEKGKKYLAGLKKEYGLDVNLKKIKTIDDLKQELYSVHPNMDATKKYGK